MPTSLLIIQKLIDNFQSHQITVYHYTGFFQFILALSCIGKLVKHEKLIVLVCLNYFLYYLFSLFFYRAGINNLLLINISDIIIGITYFTYFYLSKPNRNRIFLYLLILFLVAQLINLFFGQGFETVNTLTSVPLYLSIAFLSYISLRKWIQQDTIQFSNIHFWFMIASLINFILPVSQIALEPYMNQVDVHISAKMFIIEGIAGFSFNVFLTIGLIWKIVTNTSYSS